MQDYTVGSKQFEKAEGYEGQMREGHECQI